MMNAVVVKVVENAKESVRIMMDVASRKWDGVNETVKKGFPMDVKAVMIRLQRYASVVSIVHHVRKSVQIMRGVKGNQQKNARLIVKRSGEVVNALEVPLVDHARESVRIMKDAEGNQLDNARATVKKSGVLVKLILHFFYVDLWLLLCYFAEIQAA